MMIAEITPDAGWNVILTIALLAGIVANFATVMRMKASQKRDVSFTFVPASREEFREHVAATAVGFDRVNERISDMDLKRERTLADLHEKLNQVRDDVTFIRAACATRRNQGECP